MLQTIRAEGSKAPFFVVHGFHGAMGIAHAMGRGLDPDRPLFALHARGIDGTEQPARSIEEMVRGYLAKIRAVRPRGPYVIGGICAGSLVAFDLARALAAQGEHVRPVIVMDPPVMATPQSAAPQNRDPTDDPSVHRQLYASVEQVFRALDRHFGYMPFDVNDPARLHRAIEAGMQTVATLSRYDPPRFEGATEFIVSADRAFGHLHPQGRWREIVPTLGRMHVVPGSHLEFYSKHLGEVLRLVRFALDSPFEF